MTDATSSGPQKSDTLPRVAPSVTQEPNTPPDPPVKAGPVRAVRRDQTHVEPGVLTVENRDPQLGKDGRVYVSDEISKQAKKEGYEPDIQPRAHPDQVPQRATEADLKQAAEDHAMAVVALDAIQAPLSVKVEQAKAGNDISDVVGDAHSDVKKAVKSGDITAPSVPGELV